MDFNIDAQALSNKALDFILDKGPNVLLAVLTLLIGLRVIKLIVKLALAGLSKSSADETLQSFLKSFLTWTLKVMLFISAASMIGVQTTSFVAILGAAGLAVGLALQGTLGNFAGGVLCLLFKPYKVGDLVSAQGELGHVKEIQIFTTILTSLDNKTVIIPNGAMMNGNITNISKEGKIRVDLTIGISYDSDIKKAKQILLDTLKADKNVLQDPAPFVGVHELADSSINLAVRPWADPAVYWDVYFNCLENCKIALDEGGITIPFPQMDLHVKEMVK